MPKRTYKKPSEAHYCDACKQLALTDGTVPVALTTHSVTDAREKASGVWEETKPRYGCARHPVVAQVFYLNGDIKPFSEVIKCL